MSVCAVPTRRGLIQVKGVDASKLLQGLISQDIRILHQRDEITDMSLGKVSFTPLKRLSTDVMPAINGVIMNSKGKVMLDAQVVRNDADSFIVDCPKGSLPHFMKMFMLHKLKYKCTLQDITSQLESFAIIQAPSVASPSKYLDDISKALQTCQSDVKYMDPRFWRMGARVLIAKGTSLDSSICKTDDENLYNNLRIKFGIPEYFYSMDSAYYSLSNDEKTLLPLQEGSTFPYQLNLDWLGALSLSKGCYIGQELTTRTFHSGTVRRRLFSLHNIPPQTKIQPRDVVILPKISVSSARAAIEKINQLGSTTDDIQASTSFSHVLHEDQLPVESPDELGEIVEVSPDGSNAIVSVSWRRCELKHRSQYLALANILGNVEMAVIRGKSDYVAVGLKECFSPAPYVMEGVGGDSFPPSLIQTYAGL
eukprot:GDKJ01057738.1.p1 GENE.GDKJ01057738.1~~GDKJ01057738.1.p1  ORF type:complete len:423 (+),score=85.10 GDKJ01057738.1:3-1271(+)